MVKAYTRGLMWFRRDLRADDNAAFFHALKSCDQVFCTFIFDSDILGVLPRVDRRVEFIRESLIELNQSLQDESGHAKAGLIVCQGRVLEALGGLVRELCVDAVFFNHDDEPASLERDESVRNAMRRVNVAVHDFKDHVVFERRELLTKTGRPYSVFTPYKNAWLKKIDSDYLKPYTFKPYVSALAPRPERKSWAMPTLSSLGFEKSNLASLEIPTGTRGANVLLTAFRNRIDLYDKTRNFPAINACSYLSVHLRFGTISIRRLASAALARRDEEGGGAATWLIELIWRDFYAQILANFPHTVYSAFKPAYNAIEWETGTAADTLFHAWCEGRTGYPLVDAAMAQINKTGYMHNRLRMVTASFLIKDLGIDWRWGERYFAEKLNDFELASNNGGWQWAASSGCDAQPYFRIFNPVTQSEKFDPQGKFIRACLPVLKLLPDKLLHAPWMAKPKELAAAGVEIGKDYPEPVVQHDLARIATVERYSIIKRV
jgi:deoxyribodipyrimidine photo-lyase